MKKPQLTGEEGIVILLIAFLLIAFAPVTFLIADALSYR